jgi:hypothetical protein
MGVSTSVFKVTGQPAISLPLHNVARDHTVTVSAAQAADVVVDTFPHGLCPR